MASENTRQRVFQGMLMREAGPGADAAAVAAAALRLCERIARQLAPLIGEAGVAAICDRALYLAQQRVPRLAPVRAAQPEDGPFTRAHLFIEHQDPALVSEAALALLTTVSELLASFIGDSLTTHLLREAWADDFDSDAAEETT
jgi:hypothetical protein